jgi:hypothetical protein
MANHPKIDRIGLTHKDLMFLVWSKKDVYLYGNDYEVFRRDAAVHIRSMLRAAGCNDKLAFAFHSETCADGVFCVRVTVRMTP